MKKDFGALKNGERAELYLLKNQNGLEIAVSNYGAAWVSAWVPRDGRQKKRRTAWI